LGPSISIRLHPEDGFTVRISENARRSVLFFGTPDPAKNGQVMYGGTAFLVLHKEDGVTTCYLVTAKHVAVRVGLDSEVVLRVNKKGGGSEPFTVDNVRWSLHPDKNVDVAAMPCYLNPKEYDVAYLALADMVRRDNPETPFRISCGDPISIAGLFRLHAGSERNTPIVHSGNIALLPDPDERILVRDRVTGEELKMEAYLVEAQTLDGLSGAPVFQREMVALRTFPEHNGGPVIAATGAQLLGVYSGAWDGEPGAVTVADRNLKPDRRVPVGMGIVVPCEHITELLMSDNKLKTHRKEARERHVDSIAAVTDSALDRDVAPPATDANPTHLEDFTRLVDVAARKRPQGGQT
jgi:hypothetical protein